MNRSEILNTARDYVTRDRAATHGKAEDQFSTIGQLWGALLGQPVTAPQVALMMACLKVARAWGNPAHQDSWVDGAGYFACGGEIATSTKTPNEGLPIAVHIARRDAERAEFTGAEIADFYDKIRSDSMDTDAQTLEWPAAPIGSPPDGLGEASATDAAESAEGPSAARVWHGQDGGVE